MGKPYHVVSVSTTHSGGPDETEVLLAMYGRLAKVAIAPNATGTMRRKIRTDALRKADSNSRDSNVRVLRPAKVILSFDLNFWTNV